MDGYAKVTTHHKDRKQLSRLVLCQRLDARGVGASVVFGLRFPLYVVAAGVLGAVGFDQKPAIGWGETALIVIGIINMGIKTSI